MNTQFPHLTACPVYNNDQRFPNFYGVVANSINDYPLPYYLPGYHSDRGCGYLNCDCNCHCNSCRQQQQYFRKLVRCGPIHDPYCPSGIGVAGGKDEYGFPTCICPVSGRTHTWPVVDPHSPTAMATVYATGPFALPQH